ncbi:MAG: chemotaxis protein CheX [Planctomycetes bacterium]|nr:chemotaxis protein CheX [Planctomycetota bacterium]
MLEQHTATLTAIFSDVLADLAFMFSDDEQPDVRAGDQWLETLIGYEGPHIGTLRLRCTREFSLKLAANLLGIEPDPDSAQEAAKDATKEFMNIVCGQLITALHGTEPVFNLTLPSIHELPETPDFSQKAESQSSTLSVEGQVIQLSYFPGEHAADWEARHYDGDSGG